MNKIIEANCETGEVIERDMTPEEQAIYDTMISGPLEPQETTTPTSQE